MATLSSIFSRVAGGASTVTVSEAQKVISKAGGFGMFSMTGSMVKKGLETAMSQADANHDGSVGLDEFTTAVKGSVAAWGGPLPAWSEVDPNGSGSLGQKELAALVKAAAQQQSALGGMVDADGIAKIIITLTDDNRDGRLSEAEAAPLRADLA